MYQNGFAPKFKLKQINPSSERETNAKLHQHEVIAQKNNSSTQSAATRQKSELAGDWKGYISFRGHHIIQIVHFKQQKMATPVHWIYHSKAVSDSGSTKLGLQKQILSFSRFRSVADWENIKVILNRILL